MALATPEVLSGLIDTATAQLRKAVDARRKESAKGFAEWARQALFGGAGKAHRWTAALTAPPPAPDVVVVDGACKTQPLEVLDAVRTNWLGYWDPAGRGRARWHSPASLPPWMRTLEQEARQQMGALPRPGLHELDRALKVFKPNTGLGPDQGSPRLWLALPEEARLQLLGMLNGVLDTLRWPAQVLINFVLMQGKPEPGGLRPITLTSGFYRVFCHLHGT